MPRTAMTRARFDRLVMSATSTLDEVPHIETPICPVNSSAKNVT